MKKILLLFVFLSQFIFAQNNATSFDWSFNTGDGFNTTKRLQYNSHGDLLALIDSGHQTTFGGTITFIAKRTQSGTSSVFVQKNIVNPTYATFDDFTIDNDDNIIVVGTTIGYDSTVYYDFENTISIDYLSRLNERYEAWIHSYDKGKLLIIDVDQLDFVDNPEDLGVIINKINAEINGLF